jgi:hypothetical protein
VAFRVRRALRRRWIAVLGVTATVAIVTGSVLALAAGARRTADAPNAYTAALGGDPAGTVTQSDGRPSTAGVAALPGVAAVESYTFLFASVTDQPKHGDVNTLAFAGSRPMTTRLIAGRQADPSQPREFVADKTFVDAYDAHLGDHFSLVSWTPDQAANGGGFTDTPKGPAFEGELVGVVDPVREAKYHMVVFSRGLLDDTTIGISATIMDVRLKPGISVEQLRAGLDTIAGGSAFTLQPGRVVSTEVRNAVDAESRGLWIITAVAALAALIALGQLLSRHARLSDAERRPLSALGFTESQVGAEAGARGGGGDRSAVRPESTPAFDRLRGRNLRHADTHRAGRGGRRHVRSEPRSSGERSRPFRQQLHLRTGGQQRSDRRRAADVGGRSRHPGSHAPAQRPGPAR